MNNVKIINNIAAEKLIREEKDLLIIDVRRFSEFKESRIKNAINIPVEELEWEVEEIEEYKDKPVLVYCKVGNKSAIACDFLSNEGFNKIYDLRGGIFDFKGEIVSGK